MSTLVKKGKKKITYASSSTSGFDEIQQELTAAREKIAAQEEENKRRDLANERRDAELKHSQTRIAELEKLLTFMKNNDPRVAAYMTNSSAINAETPPDLATTSPPAQTS